jgi:hypothetical protein
MLSWVVIVSPHHGKRPLRETFSACFALLGTLAKSLDPAKTRLFPTSTSYESSIRNHGLPARCYPVAPQQKRFYLLSLHAVTDSSFHNEGGIPPSILSSRCFHAGNFT